MMRGNAMEREPKLHVLLIPSWYVNTYNSLSGIFFKEQAESLAKNDIKTGVLSVQPISFKQIWKCRKIDFCFRKYRENEVETFQVQFPSLPKLKKINSLLSYWLGKKLFKLYLKINGPPDIIHLHSYLQGELAIWIKQIYGIPYVLTEHSSVFARKKFSEDEFRRAFNVFFRSSFNMAVSKFFCNLLGKKFNQKFNYMPNIVNTDFFFPQYFDKTTYTFLNVAFLGENKNQAMLIEAFVTAFKNHLNIQLIIAGEGPCYKSLQLLIKKHGVEQQIKLFGRASRNQVLELMQTANAFVLSSKHETFGVVVIEAMSCGLPVVSTRCGGPEDIIVDPSLGIVCEQTQDALSAAMLDMRNKHDNYNSSLIRQYVVDNFSEDAVVSKLIKIYHDVLIK